MNKIATVVQKAVQATTQTAISLAPESWLPGGTPDRLAVKHGALGAPVSRLDGPLKVSGEARFAAEVQLPGLVFASLAYSTISKGRIAELETEEAERAPGVMLVMTYRNAPRLNKPKLFGTAPNAAAPSTLPIMQDEVIHWNGHPIALVLAETQEQADHAASLIRARYDEEPPVVNFESAKSRSRHPDSIMGEPSLLEVGDAEAELDRAPAKVDTTYNTPFHNHNAIELHAATCAWDGESLTVYDASQLVTATAGTIADLFGLAHEKVRVISPFVGGGFGGKCLWWHQVLGAAAAKLAGRPVRIVLSREGVYRLVGGRTTTEQRVALGATSDGKLTALIHSGVAAMTSHNNCPEQFSFPARHMYEAGAIKVEQKICDMDMLANTFMRAPGESIGTFALESAIDELATELGIDPIELRRRNEPAKDPTSGHEFSSRHLMKAYDEGARRFGWEKRQTTPRARQDGEWLIGMGCASGTYPYYRMAGATARITLHADGTAQVATAAHEMGMGTATAHTQICAERLGLPIAHVDFEYGDTALPPSPVAGGSCQTASIGASVLAAHRKLVGELLRLAGNDSPLAGLGVEDVEGLNGGLSAANDTSRHESYGSILARAGQRSLSVEANAPPALEIMRWSMHSTSAIFAEVAVSRITGEPRVRRLLGSFDCGRIINAKTAASQFRGGMIMGLGLALTEKTLFDERTGRIMNPSLAEYHVPVHLDVPKIDVIWTDIPDPHSPMGARGIGEIGITGTGAAIANAIYNATGKRIRELPITLDKLM